MRLQSKRCPLPDGVLCCCRTRQYKRTRQTPASRALQHNNAHLRYVLAYTQMPAKHFASLSMLQLHGQQANPVTSTRPARIAAAVPEPVQPAVCGISDQGVAASSNPAVALQQVFSNAVAGAKAALPWAQAADSTNLQDGSKSTATAAPAASAAAGGHRLKLHRATAANSTEGGSFVVVTEHPAEGQSLSCLHCTAGGTHKTTEAGSCKTGTGSSNSRPVGCTGAYTSAGAGSVVGCVQHTFADVKPHGITVSTSATSAATAPAGNQFRFAKHLSVLSNGCAPPSQRFESLGWLLHELKRLQAALELDATSSTQQNPGQTQPQVSLWISRPEAMHVLQHIYLVGQALADLGTADGLQPLSCSHGSRAIVSMDYAKLLERYLQQHGHLLAEEFWANLPDDELQAKAIHVATTLETRCTVHALLFDKLMERVGMEGTSAGWPAGTLAAAPGGHGHHGPLAAAVTNTLISTSQLVSSPSSSQQVVSAPVAAANGNSNSVSNNSENSSTSNSSAAATSNRPSSWLGLGGMGAVVLLVWTFAGKVFRAVVAVVVFAKAVAVQLMVLLAARTAAKGLTAVVESPVTQPTGAVCAAAVPANNASTQRSQHLLLNVAESARMQAPHATVTSMAANGTGSLVNSNQQAAVPGQAAGTAHVSTMPRTELVLLAEAVATTRIVQPKLAGGSGGNDRLTKQVGTTPATGSLGMLDAFPWLGRISDDPGATSQAQQQKQQWLQQQVLDKGQPQHHGDQIGTMQSSKGAIGQQQRPQGFKESSDRLLYHLWTPEAARFGESSASY